MAAKTLTTEQLTDLLKKARKGSTAAFGPSQWATVFAAIGWKTETILGEKREIIGFKITTSDGHLIEFKKEPSYVRITFYGGTFDGQEWHGFDNLLKTQTPWTKDLEKVIGAEAPKEEFRRPDAPTCPVCFRDILLDSSGKMVHHGYERPGHGWIVGDCFGVAYQPWELSPKGAQDFLAKVLVPTLARSEARLADLLAGKVLSFTVERPLPTYAERSAARRANMKDTKTEVVTAETNAVEFRDLTESHIRATEQAITSVKADIAFYEGKIAGWKVQPLPEYNGPQKILHWEIPSRKWGGTTLSCSAWGLRRKYAPMTTDKAAVTCKRCLKDIAEAEARAAKKAAEGTK